MERKNEKQLPVQPMLDDVDALLAKLVATIESWRSASAYVQEYKTPLCTAETHLKLARELLETAQRRRRHVFGSEER